MKLLLHPKIDWSGWQQIKQSRWFQSMSWGEQICLIDNLPLKLWQKEIAEGRNPDLLLKWPLERIPKK